MRRALPALGASAVILLALRNTASSEDAVLEKARAAIPSIRAGDLTVKAVGPDGRPAAGARVEVEMLRHQFLFGSNIFMWGHCGNAKDDEAYRDRFAALLNYATLPFYWRGYEPVRGQPGHADREEVARWCREHGIVTKGHPLVWNHDAGVPRWLPDDPAEVRKLSLARVTDCVSRFKGAIDIFDVVNEATDPWRFAQVDGRKNPLTEAIRSAGVTAVIEESFAAARAANPAARLVLNDYRTDRAYADLLEKLRKDGKPIYDIIGIQSHMHDGPWPSRRIEEVCDAYARFGVPLHFTETTIVSGKRLGPGERWGPTEPDLEEKQAREAARFYTVLFSHPAVEALTWWDFADRGAWQGAAAGFLRKDLSPKPVYEALKKLIRGEWWTRAALDADASGAARTRAFYGDYRITVSAGGLSASREVLHDRKKGATEVEVRLPGR